MDYAAARRRAHPFTGRKRFNRIRKARQRLAKSTRLRSMRKADGRLGRIFTTGIKLGSQYGVEANGVDDRELLSLRRQALSFKSPTAKGAMFRAKLALHGEPMT
eukprot:8342256-Pyramimonas_sp.AAC.1